jgi:nucleoside-diphosphate-sugar epimerase
MAGSVLVLGANGRFGRHATEAFRAAGWQVTTFDRATGDLTAATVGQDVIVNGWNPPYPDWASQLPAQAVQVLAAAQASGATVVLPGNVYVYGEGAEVALGPDVPQAARNPLGRVRIDVERSYRDSGVPVILLRAGDFLDTEASGNWFDRQMAPTLARGVLTYPGDPGVPHAWAFLPDMARAAVALAEQRAALPRFAEIAFPGYALTGQELAALCGQVLGRAIRVKPMAWWPLQLARPFWRMAPHLLEMRYLWSMPHRLTRESLDAVLPGFAETEPAEAVAQALAPVLRAD